MRTESIILSVIVAFLFGALLSTYMQGETTVHIIPQEKKSVQMLLPATDSNGNGVVANLSVIVEPGRGRVLANIDKLLFWTDTQQSIQTARDVARNFTGKCCFDTVYMIDANATVVGGPSAGAAFAIATISALEGKPLNKSVMITGTINPDGTIGQVGGIKEKAEAARTHGAKLMLVPEGQSIEERLQPVEKCDSYEGFTYCKVRYKKQSMKIAAGIDVIEVKNINEAAKYFFGE